MNGWISVRNWRKFQHYDPAKRRPLWIKTYTDLTRSDEYLELTAGERALLHGIWIEYASAQCQLKFSASSMSRRLNLRVTKQQLLALVQAGFIDVVASKVLADGYQLASPEVEEEGEEEKPSVTPSTSTSNGTDGRTDDIDFGFNLDAVLKDIPA